MRRCRRRSACLRYGDMRREVEASLFRSAGAEGEETAAVSAQGDDLVGLGISTDDHASAGKGGEARRPEVRSPVRTGKGRQIGAGPVEEKDRS